MICSYVRASSIANLSFCSQQYFLNYVLGIRQADKLRSTKGTITHKILECIAQIQLQAQSTNGINWLFEDKCIKSPYKIHRYDILKPCILSNDEVNYINSTRVNKQVYCDNPQLKYGHTRYGIELVEHLIEDVYNYYFNNTPHDWKPVDRKDVKNWTWMALDYKDGMFDPRKRKIIQPEIEFDIPLEYPWAKYKFKVNNETFEGQLALRGTIDLVMHSHDDDNVIEILDYKTGSRINWAGNREDKTYEMLEKDPQLMIYYYAARKLFPEKDILTTIFWIRDGGPFTFCFDDNTVEQVEKLLQSKFEEIKRCKLPRLTHPTQNCFKCTCICDYYKMKSSDPERNMCKFIHDEVKEKGINYTTNKYNRGNFNEYQSPGEI